MHCTETHRVWRWGAIALAASLAACGTRPTGAPPQGGATAPMAPGKPSGAAPAGLPTLAPAPSARSWDDFKRLAALRMVAANPSGTYMTVPPHPLLAIPVLEIELDHDGQVRRIGVLRVPSQAKDTTQLAIDAVRRAAPFGSVAHLPQPWKFAEVFLFDDDRRFKPRTLDE